MFGDKSASVKKLPKMDATSVSRSSLPQTPTIADSSSTVPLQHQDTGQGSSTQQKPLSCVNCRQHKIKCNRENPCNRCKRSGLECVFPIRVRKARHGGSKRDTELLQRIGRLEKLVERVGGEKAEVLLARDQDPSGSVNSPVDVDASSPVVHGMVTAEYENDPIKPIGIQYLGADFWTNLGTQVDGLKSLLELSDEEDEVDNSPSDLRYETQLSPVLLFGARSRPNDAKSLSDIPQEKVKILFDKYFSSVDPIFKLLHKPTTAVLFSDVNKLNNRSSASFQALRLSMYFAAVTSYTSECCLQSLGQEKGSLLAQIQPALEIALSDADFLNSMEIMTLQAFVLYVVSH
jgi:hypothetical protein